MKEPTIENLKCCGNCSNNDTTDGGTLQCSYEEHLSTYNYATCPSGVCDKWKFDENIYKKRLLCIDNSCPETTEEKQ